MKTTDPSLQHLVPSLCSGDTEAYRVLVRDLSPELLGYARSILGDWASAQDVVQDAWVSLYRSRRRIGKNLRVYCFKIVRNHALSLLRSKGRRDRREQGSAAMYEARKSNQAEDAALANELWEAAGDLPESQRDVIMLRYRHGLMLGEVASVLGIPEGTVSTRQRQGLESLRDRYRLASAPALVGLLQDGSKPVVPSEILVTMEGVVMAAVGKKSISMLAVLLLLLLAGGGAAVGVWFANSESSDDIANRIVAVSVSSNNPEGDNSPEPDSGSSESSDVPTKPDTPVDPTANDAPEDGAVSNATIEAAPPVDFDKLTIVISGTVKWNDKFVKRQGDTILEIVNNPLSSSFRGAETSQNRNDPIQTLGYGRTMPDDKGEYKLSFTPRDYIPPSEHPRVLNLVVRVWSTSAYAYGPANLLLKAADITINIPEDQEIVEKSSIDFELFRERRAEVIVKDRAGDPVKNARVSVRNKYGDIARFRDGSVMIGTTNVSGRCKLYMPADDASTVTSGGRYLLAEKEGYAPGRCPDWSLNAIVLDRSSDMEGVLIGAGSTPLSTTELSASFATKTRNFQRTGKWQWIPVFSGERRTLTTDETGAFSLANVPETDFQLRIVVSGYSVAEFEILAVGGGRTPRKFQLTQQSVLRLKFIDERSGELLPIGSFTLSKVDTDAANPFSPTITDGNPENGMVSVEDLDSGKWLLVAWLAGDVARCVEYEFAIDTGEVIEQDVSVQPRECGVISGKVLDAESDKPLDAKVKLVAVGPHGKEQLVETLTANESGYFEFTNLIRRNYRLRVRKRGFSEQRCDIDLIQDWDGRGQTIAMSKYSYVQLLLPEISSEAAQSSSLRIFYHVVVRYSDGTSWTTRVLGDREKLPIFRPGPFSVRFGSASCGSEYYASDEQTRHFDGEPGKTYECSFRDVRVGSVSGTVRNESGELFEPHRLQLVRVGPDTTLSSLLASAHGTLESVPGSSVNQWGRISVKDGKWEVFNVIPGRYFLIGKKTKDSEYTLIREFFVTGGENEFDDILAK